jgi:hypothetical protein
MLDTTNTAVFTEDERKEYQIVMTGALYSFNQASRAKES